MFAQGRVVAVPTKRFSVYEPRPQKKPTLVMKSIVVRGFGRGGKQLGCPTANLEDHVLKGDEETGVWMGWAKNEKKTCEPHIMHNFDSDFYGEPIEIALCGYLRPEKNFKSLEDLKQAIANDIEIARVCLDDPEFVSEKKLLQ